MATQHIQISEELEMLFKEMADRPRRTDMVNAAKNVALDMDAWINAVKIVIKHDVNCKIQGGSDQKLQTFAVKENVRIQRDSTPRNATRPSQRRT